MHGKSTARERELAISALAGRQQGVITRRQLLASGLGAGAIEHRLKTGQLNRLHAGVYLVGHTAQPRLARVVAAVLACGDDAVVSHRSAVALWRLLPIEPPRAVDITVARPWRPDHPGIRIRSTGSLPGEDVRRIEGIPVTAPVRTIFDFAACASARELERVVAEACARPLVSRSEVEERLPAHRGRRGVARLRVLLAAEAGPALTRSAAEELMLALLRRHGFEGFEVNPRVAGFEVDFLWRRERVIVEIEGYAFHSSPSAFEWDRARAAELTAQGFQVIRVTWRQLVDSPTAVIARIRRTLTGRARENL